LPCGDKSPAVRLRQVEEKGRLVEAVSRLHKVGQRLWPYINVWCTAVHVAVIFGHSECDHEDPGEWVGVANIGASGEMDCIGRRPVPVIPDPGCDIPERGRSGVGEIGKTNRVAETDGSIWGKKGNRECGEACRDEREQHGCHEPEFSHGLNVNRIACRWYRKYAQQIYLFFLFKTNISNAMMENRLPDWFFANYADPVVEFRFVSHGQDANFVCPVLRVDLRS